MKKPFIVCDEQIPFARETFSRLGPLTLVPAEEIIARNIRSADCLIVRSVTRVGHELISGTRIRAVGSVTSGVDHIDASALQKMGVDFISAPGSNAESVAEYVVASLLVLAERLGAGLKGLKIGIIGVGQVGTRVDEKCRALGMKTIWNDPPLKRRAKDPKYRPLSEALQADIITLHVPLTIIGRDRTFRLAGKDFFGRLNRPCIFINTARGRVMDERSLFEARRKGMVRAIVLDVWPDEPDVDPDLLGICDIATPHIAGYSLDGKARAVDMVYKGLCRYYKIRDDWSVLELLPKSGGSSIKIRRSEKTREDRVRQAVLRVYDPRVDDQKLRKIRGLTPAKRKEYFEGLRRRYPVRREFDSYRIDRSGTEPELRRTLRKLGFRC